jgi:hypothetical protein
VSTTKRRLKRLSLSKNKKAKEKQKDPRETLKDEIKRWVTKDFGKNNDLLRINQKQSQRLVESFIDKYYDAPKEYLRSQIQLSSEEWKTLRFHTSIVVASLAFVVSFVYIEIVWAWDQIISFISDAGIVNLLFGENTILTGILVMFGTSDSSFLGIFFLVTFIVFILIPGIFYFVIKLIIFPIIRNFVVSRQNRGDIERYIIERILEKKIASPSNQQNSIACAEEIKDLAS